MNLEGHAGGPPLGRASIILGLIVMLVGLTLLADRVGLGGFRVNLPIWPVVVVLIGTARLKDRVVDARGRTRLNRAGIWLIIVGVWGFINEYRLFGLHYGTSWPLLVIGVGAMVVWRALDPV